MTWVCLPPKKINSSSSHNTAIGLPPASLPHGNKKKSCPSSTSRDGKVPVSSADIANAKRTKPVGGSRQRRQPASFRLELLGSSRSTRTSEYTSTKLLQRLIHTRQHMSQDHEKSGPTVLSQAKVLAQSQATRAKKEPAARMKIPWNRMNTHLMNQPLSRQNLRSCSMKDGHVVSVVAKEIVGTWSSLKAYIGTKTMIFWTQQLHNVKHPTYEQMHSNTSKNRPISPDSVRVMLPIPAPMNASNLLIHGWMHQPKRVRGLTACKPKPSVNALAKFW